MRKGKLYSTDEDKVIRECIKKNVGNIDNAFKEAQRLLPNRTISGLKGRWYIHLRTDIPVFKTNSNKIVLTNTKNTKSRIEKPFILLKEEKEFIKFVRRNPEYVNLKEIRANIIEKALKDLKLKLEENED